MKNSIFAIFVITFSLTLSASESLTKDIISSLRLGFEETSLKWAANEAGATYLRQDFDHLKFLTTTISLGTIQRNFLLKAGFSSAFYGRGTLEQETRLLSRNAIPVFEANTKGSTFRPDIQLGYYIHLTPDHLNKIILIPKLGYSAFYFNYYVKKPGSDIPVFDNIQYSDLATIKTLKQFWYGFLLGASASLQTYDGFSISLSYYYHFDHLNHKFKSQFLQTNLTDNYQNLIFIDAEKKTPRAFSHEAILNVDYLILDYLSLGALMQYQYLCANNDPMTMIERRYSLDSGMETTYQRGLTFSCNHEVFSVYFSLNLNF